MEKYQKPPGLFARIMDNPLLAFVFWFAVFAAGIAISVLVPVLIEVLIVPMAGCSATALSFLRKRKVLTVDRFEVQLPDGKSVPVTVYQEKKYVTGYSVLIIFAFFSPFFYIPYNVRYHLVKGAIASQSPVIQEFLLNDCGLFRTFSLSKKDYLALKGNPQALAADLAAEARSDREKFWEAARPFLQAGVMNEDFCGTYHAVLSFTADPDSKLLCFYSGKRERQYGFMVDNDTAAQFCESVISHEAWTKLPQSNSCLSFDATTLERLVRSQMKGEQAPLAEETPAEAGSALHTAMDDINEQKKPLTDEVLAEAFQKTAKRKTVFGGILCFLSSYGFIGAVAGVANGLFVLAGVSVMLFFVCLFFGIKKIRAGKTYKKIIRAGNYRVEKATCIASKQDTGEDGGLLLYVCDFDNGLTNRVFRTELRKGDFAYFAYLDEKHIASFSGLEYYRPM